MRNLIGCVAVLFLFWLGLCLVTLIMNLLFSNLITGSITFLAAVGGLLWLLYKVTTTWLDESNKEGK
jgi:membrane protein implicated in regulation of membrane protease activity